MKKIMIISSDYTGHGHKSIGESLIEQLALLPDVETEVVEGFRLFGRAGVKAGGMYGPITRMGHDFWKLSWDISSSTPDLLVQMMVPMLHDRFMARLKYNPPSLILSIHPVFNATILDVLQAHEINIPFVSLLADLVDIHPLWADKRATHILCPTDESMDACMMLGMPRSILRRCGFPTRRQFSDLARNTERKPYTCDRPLECLLMSGGEGSGNLRTISELLLDNFNARVTVICGRNKRVYNTLTKHLGRYGNRIRILGFCDNIQDYMMESDVAFMRGSPNSMLEAVITNTPLVVTGSLPGQEARNPEYAQMHGLGVTCRNLKQIPPLMQGLLADGAVGLNQIAEKQRYFRNFDNALEISNFLVETALENPPVIAPYENRFPKLMQATESYRKLEAGVTQRKANK